MLQSEISLSYNDKKWYAEPAEAKFIVTLSKLFDKQRDILAPWCWLRGWKKVGRRAERLAWLEHMVGRAIHSSNGLTNGEAHRICNWIDGLYPYTGEPHHTLEPQELAHWRQTEIRQWLRRNHQQIIKRATKYRRAKIGVG